MQRTIFSDESKYLWGVSSKYKRDGFVIESLKRTYVLLNFVKDCDIQMVIDTLKRTYSANIESVQDYSDMFEIGDSIDLSHCLQCLQSNSSFNLIYFVSGVNSVTGNTEWLQKHKCINDLVITNNGSILSATKALK